ncbi:MAG: MFS transporter [Pseudopedobacter sp.]|nr:MFS transporter [Deinococcales bacterium]
MTTQPAPPGALNLSTQARGQILLGVILALLLGALDQTIVSTAGPAIQSDLNISNSLYTWLTIGYLVTSTVVVPIYGRLGDLYGRKIIILFGMALFIVASLLCAISWDALSLIGFRALQGLGGGALFTTAFAIVADLYPPAERGRINGALGGVFGLSSVLGPLVGGFITDNFSWHWIFLVNLPLGLIAMAFIWRMPNLRSSDVGGKVDYAGAFWLVVAVIPLLLALSLGKSNPQPGETAYAWTSPQILGGFALFVIGLGAFVFTELRSKDPLVDLKFFRNRTFALANLSIFFLGASFLAAIIFLPLFMVNVVGLSATGSGLTTTPLTFGLIASAITSGILTQRYGRYKPVMLGSLVVLMIGFAVMGFTLTPQSTQLEVTFKMILLGLGLGAVVSLYSLAVQNALPPENTGIATSSTSFFQQMGGTVGLAILGTIFASTITDSTTVRAKAAGLPPAQTSSAGPVGKGAPERGGAPNLKQIQKGISAGFATQRGQYEKAFNTRDTAAAQELLKDPKLSEPSRGALEGIVNNTLPESARPQTLQGILTGLNQGEKVALENEEKRVEVFKGAFTDGIKRLYQIGILIVLIGFFITALLPEIPLRKSVDGDETPAFAG